MAGLFEPNDPPRTISVPLECTPLHNNHLLDVWFSWPQTAASSPSLQPKVTPQHSAPSLLPTKVTSAQQQYIE